MACGVKYSKYLSMSVNTDFEKEQFEEGLVLTSHHTSGTEAAAEDDESKLWDDTELMQLFEVSTKSHLTKSSGKKRQAGNY